VGEEKRQWAWGNLGFDTLVVEGLEVGQHVDDIEAVVLQAGDGVLQEAAWLWRAKRERLRHGGS
jgi:hypothetical protein